MRRGNGTGGTMMRTLGRAVLAAALAASVGAATAGAAEARCTTFTVAMRACVAETTYPRSPLVPAARPPRLLGFFSAMSFYGGRGGYAGIDDDWERARIREVGGNAQRWLVSWRGVQPSGTTPAFLDAPLGTVQDRDPVSHAVAVSDARYLGLLAAGMVPVIGIYDTPSWATAADAWPYRRAPGLGAWAAFVRALAKRYPQAVLEGYNTPNAVHGADARDAIPAERMAAMQAALDAQARMINPGQTVLGPALAIPDPDRPRWGLADYAATLYANGLAGAIDGFSVHVYPGPAVRSPADLDRRRNGFTATLEIIRAARAAAGDSAPLWITEAGVTTGRRDRGVSEAAQRDILLEMDRRLRAMPDVKAVLYYALRDRAGPEMARQGFDAGLGWLRADQSRRPGRLPTPKPVFCAFAKRAGTSYRGC